MLLRRIATACVFALIPSLGWAQGTLQAMGPLVPGHAVMAWDSSHVIDAGGPTVNGSPADNSVNSGTMPLGYAWVNSGLGSCGFSAYATATYHTNCWGFDGSGNGLWSYDSTNIAKATTSGFQLLGTPTAPTPAAGTNTTQLATAAFVLNAIATAVPTGLPFINATAYNIPAHGTDGTTQAQAAMDAANSLSPAAIYFPKSFDFTKLRAYPNVKILCGGARNLLYRTAVGQGLFWVTTPLANYPDALIEGVVVDDCQVESSGLAGVGIMLSQVDTGHLRNVSSTGTDSAASMFRGTIAADVLTVSALTSHTPIVAGQMVLCGACGVGNVGSNTYARIQGFGSGGTTGTGGTGTYKLDTSFAVGIANTMAFVGSTPWTWSGISGLGGNTLFPSANVGLFSNGDNGASIDWRGGQVGVDYLSHPYTGACPVTSGIGLYFDATTTNGLGKSNLNLIDSVYNFCSGIGIFQANGADNTFINDLMQNTWIGWACGSGAGNAFRNIVMQMYYEHATDIGGGAAMQFGSGCTDNIITGLGSLSESTFSPIYTDQGSNTRQRIAVNNDFTMITSPEITTFHNAMTVGGASGPPTPPNFFSRYLDCDDNHNCEIDIKVYQSGEVGVFAGILQHNQHDQTPAAVGSGELLAVFGGRGQYDTTKNDVCNFVTATFGGRSNGLPCGFVGILSAEAFSAAGWGTDIGFYTTTVGTVTTPVKRWAVLANGSLRGYGTTSGTSTITVPAAGGTTSLAMPINTTGTIVSTGDTATVTRTMLTQPPLTGTSASIGGGALGAGACATDTVAITGATAGMGILVSAETNPGATIYYKGRVSAPNQITVDVCSATGSTPTASLYDVRVIQ